MNILVTGTEGYLGTLLAPLLLGAGHRVLGVDTGFYKAGWLYRGTDMTAETLDKDIRHIGEDDLEGIDAVVHMAELSNDPVGELVPNITYDINHKASVRLARLAKQAGVARFVYMSSCSVYGIADQDVVDETSAVNPQTAYADCKIMVERDLQALADDGFSPTYLRNAAAFGASPRMRFDIVINNLSGWAWTVKELRLDSDGTPWRPFVHALDIAGAIVHTLEAPRERIHNQILNVGANDTNYQIRTIANLIADIFPDCTLSMGTLTGTDTRSYRVNFDKIRAVLPGFRCNWNAEDGIRQLREVFEHIDLSEEVFLSRGFTRLKQIQYLLASGQIDPDFFWRPLTVQPHAAATPA